MALANAFSNSVAQGWGMAHPRMHAAPSLPHERTARALPALRSVQDEPPPALAQRVTDQVRSFTPSAQTREPTHLLSNSAGCSRWDQTGITRWRDSALRDTSGTFLCLNLRQGEATVSVSQHPAADPKASCQSR